MNWIEFLVQEINDEETNLKRVGLDYTDPKVRSFYKKYTEAKIGWLRELLNTAEPIETSKAKRE